MNALRLRKLMIKQDGGVAVLPSGQAPRRGSQPVIAAEISMSSAARALHDESELLQPAQSSPLDLTIFVSCFNEAKYIVDTISNITAALDEVGNLEYEIIVIDDASSDHSADLVNDYIQSHPEQRLILRRNNLNRGLAQNYFDAAFIGKGKYYRLMCGDDCEPKETILKIFRQLDQADILIPYPNFEGRSQYRKILSKAFVTLVNLVSGFRLNYYNGLAVHLRYNVMRWHPNTRGFGFQADIICMLLEQGCSYKEIEIRTIERKGDDSSALSWKNVLSIAHTISDIVIRRAANRAHRPKRSARVS